MCGGRNAQSLAKALERRVPSDTDDVAPEHALQVKREERDAEADGFGETGLVHVCARKRCVNRPGPPGSPNVFICGGFDEWMRARRTDC